MNQANRIIKNVSRSTTHPNVAVFVENHDSLINELWVWVSQQASSPLEGLSGLMIDGVSHRAIFETLESALRLLPFLEQAAKKSNMKFHLVRFAKDKTLAAI